ncbi:AIPR family protein [Pseudorhodoferax sp. Leaf274]|uniref:AIPR family protein n=1 Tax=Pseudorhodoferax sp. Leaf274 TaxID=1736318 RepID=UPI0009EA0349|nr:AIPR family protein [Pseudorhodoferax sp. Leaf274]
MQADLKDILDSIDELAHRGSLTRSRAFAAWFAITFFDIEEDDALESAAADGGNDQGIDIAFADASSEEIMILQAHCPENFTKTTPKAKWDAVVAAIPYIRKPKLLSDAGRPDLAEQLQSLQKANPTYTYTVGLITLGKKSDQIDRSVTAHSKDPACAGINFFHYAQDGVLGKYQSLMDAEAGIPEDHLQFSGNYFEDSGEYGRAWVGSVSAGELKRLHTAHQDKLFAGNIRLFLGARKGGINEQIIRTAQTSPGNFWALNNGITIVADSASPIGKAKGSGLQLKRFSIVNGCQTTSSLVRADAKEKAKVLARVIAAKVGLKNEIVRYNNSQNAVKIWTVRAADEIQEQLRKEFQKVGVTYAPKQAGSRRRRDALTIELDKVTQYLASAEPAYLIQAIDNKSELFDEPYQKLFKKGIGAPSVYLAWLVGQFADEERQKHLEGLGEDENAPLLGVTSTYWITYCTFKIFAKLSDLSSPQITVQRMRANEFENSLRKYVKKAVEMFYDAAVDSYDREQYGSFKSTLRSSKFLAKIDSKINSRIVKLTAKSLPDLAATAKSVKVS